MSTLDPGEAASPPEKGRRGILSIEAAGHLLQALGVQGHPVSLHRLANAAGMAPGKLHPYLVSLEKLGLVTQEAATGHYWLGPTAMELGLQTLRTINPVREATPFAEQLARDTGHSVALSVWGNQGPTVVALFDALYPLHINIHVGTVMSLAGTATGRLFMAYLPHKLIEQSLRDDARRLGPDIAPPVTAGKLQELLQEVRTHGLSRCVDSPTAGVSSFAAPVFDYSGGMTMAITLLGHTQAFDAQWQSAAARAILACSVHISTRLGALPLST